MNDQLKQFAIDKIRTGLAKLPEDQQHNFKLMYARGDPQTVKTKDYYAITVEDMKAMSIDEVILKIPDEKLDWVMEQVQNSLKELKI